jgi:hypothetical protein
MRAAKGDESAIPAPNHLQQQQTNGETAASSGKELEAK